MKICVVSGERRIERLVREVVQTFPGAEYECAARPDDEKVVADLYIRDYVSAESIPRDPEASGEASLFLVDREHLTAFHERVGNVRVSVLLKPVTKSVLRTAVGRHLASRPAPVAAATDSRSHDRDELLECLLLASLKLQRHNLERTNFLARALHDFRAPLTAANGYCGLLIRQHAGLLNPEQTEMLRRMQRSLEHLTTLSETMFQLSAGEWDTQPRAFDAHDIEACVERAVEEVLPSAEVRDLAISVQVVPQAKFPFDPVQIRQAMVHLLENACRFTPSHGLIEVRGYPIDLSGLPRASSLADRLGGSPESAPTAYRIDVSDSGPSIPPEDVHRIFEQYISHSGSRDRSGIGLGLATCKMIVAAHGGEIFAESRTGGATFSFILPLFQEEPGEKPALAAHATGGGTSETTIVPETK